MNLTAHKIAPDFTNSLPLVSIIYGYIIVFYTDGNTGNFIAKASAWIGQICVKHNADCIVFEKLDIKGKLHGKDKQRLAMWRKNGIQSVAALKAHRKGIRISHICAWKTSKLAYDGSGEVVRDENNYSLCTFTNKKQYNCDLNASYNIGARYFIREITKTLPVKER